MSTTDPPIGTSDAFRHDDPDAPAEERRANPRDLQDRIGEQDRSIEGTYRTLEEKADQLVKRENGVSSFADAEEIDAMERPPSVRDQENEQWQDTGNVVTDAVTNAWRAAKTPDSDKRS